MERHADDNMIGLKIDGVQYALTVQDYGSHWKLRVYQNDRVIGFRDYPFATEITKGVMAFTVRSIVRQHAKEAKA